MEAQNRDKNIGLVLNIENSYAMPYMDSMFRYYKQIFMKNINASSTKMMVDWRYRRKQKNRWKLKRIHLDCVLLWVNTQRPRTHACTHNLPSVFIQFATQNKYAMHDIRKRQ